MTQLNEWIHDFFHFGINNVSPIYSKLISLALVVLVAILMYFLVRFILNLVHRLFISKTKTNIDDILFNEDVLRNFSHTVPPFMVLLLAPFALSTDGFVYHVVENAAQIYLTLAFLFFVLSLNMAIFTVINQTKRFRNRPLKGLLQSIQIILIIVASIFVLSILLNTPPITLLTTLGASAAILMLVFKDSILGVVAGVQLAANNMVQVGDWITVPGTQVDGDILEVNLTTVKVQNFDKTIFTIPPYVLTSKPFQNWKGMQNAGGRRIKRSILIDMTSVHFAQKEELDLYKNYTLVTDYITRTEAKIEKDNQISKIDKNFAINGLGQTNLGVFRAYLTEYLKKNEAINDNMLLMVRQLQPTEFGLPLEIYCFSKSNNWTIYEATMSDVFDHVIAAVSFFDLRLFQRPTGSDFNNIN